MQLNRFFKTWGLPAILALTGMTALAQVPYSPAGTIITDGQNLYATGGDVQVKFLGKGPATDTDLLYYGSTLLFDNQTSLSNSIVDLGTIPAGTLMTFKMQNFTQGYTFYSGAGSLNPDSDVHAYIVTNYPTLGSTYVGFEDRIAPGADFNYSDVQFSYTGVATVAPEPSTLALAGTAAAGFIGWRRRK